MHFKFNHFFFDSIDEFNNWLIVCKLNKPVNFISSNRYDGYDWFVVNKISCYVPQEHQMEFEKILS